jgi:type I restriction enzyme S subunit
MSLHSTPVRLGEILKKSEDWIEIEPQAKYKQVTVKLWGQGVELRQEVSGTEISANRQLRVHHDQFILSRIDARNGAFGLVPQELEGAIVSNDFPTFNVNTDQLFPKYLGWLSKTSNFVELCKAASEGTTNRVRLKEDRFLALEIPLPPLEEQRRIVARIEAISTKLEEAQKLKEEAFTESESLLGAYSTRAFEAFKMTGHQVEIGKLISFRNDLIRPSDGEFGKLRFVGLQHIESHTGRKIGEDYLLAQELTGRKFRFSPGEIVYGYLRPYLNKVWIADCEGICSVDQYVIRPNQEFVDTEYLAQFMRSPIFLEQAIELTHNLLLPRLRTALLEGIRLPLPSLFEQKRLCSYLKETQEKM